MQTNYDVVVVGGGPAGTSAAIGLTCAGWHVTLLDRAWFPRDKACGEFLTPQAYRLLCALGVGDTLERAGLRRVRAAILNASNGVQSQYVPNDAGSFGYTIRRAALDSILLERARLAGVAVQEGFAVRHLLRDDAGCVTGIYGTNAQGEPQEVRARLTLGADGTHSLVARQLHQVRPVRRLQRVAVVTHWRDVAGANDTLEMQVYGQTVCGLGFPGAADGSDAITANLTLVVPTQAAARLAGRTAEFVEEALEMQFPALAARFAGAQRLEAPRTVGCFGHVCPQPFADGALLVGDAATFIDPFTGEGVYFALRGSELAVETANAALRSADVSARSLCVYQRLRRQLRQRYLLCDVVQAVVRTPQLLEQAVRRLERYPAVAARLYTILGDTRAPAAALHPLSLWRLVAPESLTF